MVRNKSYTALWIVSNCGVHDRNKYVKELQNNSVKVDVLGMCGRKDPCNRNISCLETLFSKYKFYIAFENSHCEDYISEKPWKALYGNMVPIAMGPPLKNYEMLLPPNSFLHVKNFTSAKRLAHFLHYLDSNDTAYQFFHRWRKEYEVVPLTGDLPVNSLLWVCDMCKKMHDPPRPAYKNTSSWWNSDKMCSK